MESLSENYGSWINCPKSKSQVMYGQDGSFEFIYLFKFWK